MTNISSLNRYANLCLYSATRSFVQKPKIVPILKSELKQLTPVLNLVKPKSKQVSIDDVKTLFENDKIDGGSLHKYMYSIKAFLFLKGLFNKKFFNLWKHSVNLDNKLKPDDYKEIIEFMNLHNGKFIEKWKDYSTFDEIPNYQKLALFVRSVRRTNELNFFKNLNEKQWETCIDGIVNRPESVVKLLLEYKLDSSSINWCASTGVGKKSVLDKVDKIESYLNTQKTKSEMNVFRGEKTFDIFSQIKVENKTTLDKVLERYTDEIEKGKHLQKNIEEFSTNKLLSVEVKQNRFMSTGLARQAGVDYAKKLLWNIKLPQNTKASMIEG